MLLNIVHELLDKFSNKRSELKHLSSFRKKKSNEILQLMWIKVEQPRLLKGDKGN